MRQWSENLFRNILLILNKVIASVMRKKISTFFLCFSLIAFNSGCDFYEENLTPWHKNAVPFAASVEKFLNNHKFKNGERISIDTIEKENIVRWICKNLNITKREINNENFPILVAAAIRSMYSFAAIEEQNEDDIYEHIIQNPHYRAWSYCGGAQGLMFKILDEFGYGVINIPLFHLKSGHSALMYEDRAFGQWTFYDPLYSIYLINNKGKPASVFDILEQITHKPYGEDFEVNQLSYKPYHVFDTYSFVSEEKKRPTMLCIVRMTQSCVDILM